MPLCRYSLVLVALSWIPVAGAQTLGDKKPEEGNDKAEVRFTDDSIVRMSILQDKLDIVTKYGKLTVPIADIIKIDFGVHVPADLEKKISQAIQDLGSENFKTRDMALKDLVSWGPYAYPQLYKAAKSESLEVAKRAQMAMDKLKAKHPARNLRLREEDVIVTPMFTVVGQIVTPTLKAKAENFGQLELQITKLRALRSLSAMIEIEATVDAAKYANQNQWMDSGFEVAQGMRLHITATGMVNLWPQNGGFMSSPRGFDNQGGFGPKGMGTNFAPGALLGKIGESGPMFLIGERYDGTPDREGKLYLHISPSPWVINQSVGTYNVKIAPKSEFSPD